MLFFKHTASYEFVSLLEKLEIRHMYINIIIYLLKLSKLNYCIKRDIKKTNNKEKIELFADLFKERFYLEKIKDLYDTGTVSNFTYNIINNIIICEMHYEKFSFHIECGIADNKFSIYILTNKYKGVNITEDTLKLQTYYDICTDALQILGQEILLVLSNIFLDTITRMRKVKKNV